MKRPFTLLAGMATALGSMLSVSSPLRRTEDDEVPALSEPGRKPTFTDEPRTLLAHTDLAEVRAMTRTNDHFGVTVPTYRPPLRPIPGGDTPAVRFQARTTAALRAAQRASRGQLRGRKQRHR